MPELRSVAFTSGDGVTPIPSYVAVPDGAGPHPTVLILRGVAGPDDGYTEIAERLAGWGYAALMHGWKIRGNDPSDDLVYADMQGAIAYLHSVREADMTRLAVFGFCRGGVHAFMAARAHNEIRAIVVFHGFAFRSPRAQPGAELRGSPAFSRRALSIGLTSPTLTPFVYARGQSGIPSGSKGHSLALKTTSGRTRKNGCLHASHVRLSLIGAPGPS